MSEQQSKASSPTPSMSGTQNNFRVNLERAKQRFENKYLKQTANLKINDFTIITDYAAQSKLTQQNNSVLKTFTPYVPNRANTLSTMTSGIHTKIPDKTKRILKINSSEPSSPIGADRTSSNFSP